MLLGFLQCLPRLFGAQTGLAGEIQSITPSQSTRDPGLSCHLTRTALDGLGQNVTLDPERKVAMASNLQVMLCIDKGAQSVVNAGSLSQ